MKSKQFYQGDYSHHSINNTNNLTKPVMRKSFVTKFCLLAFAGMLSITNTSAQFVASWALTANKNVTAVTGTQASSVDAGTMLPGVNFPDPGTHNTDGYKCQIASGSWPAAATDGDNIDFPLSPLAGFDLTISSVTFAAKTSGSSGSSKVSLAYQSDGAGAWIAIGTVQNIPSGGTTNINFTALNSLLFDGHTYVVRVYVFGDGSPTSSRSVSIKNFVINGTAAIAGTPPVVTTDSARATGKYFGIGYGSITAGTLSITASGVCWGLAPNPLATGPFVNIGGPLTAGSIGSGTGGNITGLTAGTTYHVRAYATTLAGAVYGADSTFTTDPATAPSLTTKDPHSFPIFARLASSGGVFIDSGGVAVSEKGVCWSTSPIPTLSDPHTNDGQFATDYTSAISNLLPNTLYYVRAYAINAVDTGYGNVDTFTTALQTTEIIVTPQTINFGNIVINSTSAASSFTVSGYILSPAADFLTITAPAGFQVSTANGSGYASSITIPYAGGTLNPTVIYVKLTPVAYGPINGSITVSGGTAVSQSVAVLGFGVQSPGDLSNRGTDFWVGYATHNLMYDNATDLQSNGGDQTMVLYFTSDIDAVVTVSIPGLGQTIAAGLTVPANTVQSVVVPKSLGGTLPPNSTQLYREGLFNSAIHIESDNGVPIVAYAHIYGNLVSGASLLLPTTTWSTQYYAISTPQITSSGSSTGSYNYFFVVAKEDGTQIEITPTVNTLGGLVPGVVTTVTLNKGQIYNVLATKVGNEDVSGSYVKSLDCSKKIALFSGSGRTGINSGCNTSPSSDNLFQQVFPSVVWGTKYLTSRTIGTVPENVFRVCVKDPLTAVTVNGVPISTAYPGAVLTNNFFYEFRDSLPVKIEATKPVMVAQYCTSVQGCTQNGINVNGDPEMILISPVQQSIKNVTLYSPSNQNISFPYINVIIPKTGVSSFTLGGVNQSAVFVQHPQDTGYAYASFSAAEGVALNSSVTLSSNIGFTAIAYGFADATLGGSNPRRESYGYNAGAQLNDLSNPIIIQNPYGTPINSANQAATTCRGTSFKIAATLPYETNKITFGFLGNTHISPNTDTTLQAATGNLTADSSFIVSGQTYYVYRLSTPYTFDAIGDYIIQVTSFNPTSADGGCPGGSDKTINYTIKVIEGVTPDFAINYNSCASDTVKLTDQSNGQGYAISQWKWSYNNGSIALPAPSDTLQNPTLANPANNTAGNYTLKAINNIGCFADTTKALPIAIKPVVSFASLNAVCTNTASFTLTGGTPATVTGIGTGVYSGPGVSAAVFNPATAGTGTHTIKYVYTTQAGCSDSATQTINVAQAATLTIAPVAALCTNSAAVTLVPNVTGGIFTGTGVSGNTFDPSIAGVGTFNIGYSIPANACTVPAMLPVVVSAGPAGFSAGADIDAIFGYPATLRGTGPSTNTYLWSPAATVTNPNNLVTTISATVSTLYTLTATNSNGCVATDEVQVNITKLCIDPPAVFTPNADGFYDKWVVINGTCSKQVSVNVYNRWGGLVYENSTYANNWDGTYKGKALPDATYYYIVQATLRDGQQITLKGNVTIMR